MAFAFNPPPIRGLGTAGGFEVYVQGRIDADPQRLHAGGPGSSSPSCGSTRSCTGINTFFRPTVPQLLVEVDREKAHGARRPGARRLRHAAEHDGLALRQRLQQVRAAPTGCRCRPTPRTASKPEDLGNVYVRSRASGEMIPLTALITRQAASSAPSSSSASTASSPPRCSARGKPGVSSGDAIARGRGSRRARRCPPATTIAWTGQAFQEKRSRQRVDLRVRLRPRHGLPDPRRARTSAGRCRWRCCWRCRSRCWARCGVVLLRGMRERHLLPDRPGRADRSGGEERDPDRRVRAAGHADGHERRARPRCEAARLRFRPIVMTSLAFVLGVLPLVMATGAGAAARQSMGTGVFGGMIVATFVATDLRSAVLHRDGASASRAGDRGAGRRAGRRSMSAAAAWAARRKVTARRVRRRGRCAVAGAGLGPAAR